MNAVREMQFAFYFLILLGWAGIPIFRSKLALIIAPAAITVVLFFFALFQQLGLGILVIKIAGLLLLAYTLISAIKSNVVRKLLIESALSLFFILSLSFFASNGMSYFAWDEFSHWGAQVEYLHAFGELPVNYDIALFPEYIPGLGLWRYFARTTLVDFGPAAAYLSGWVVVFSCFTVALHSLKKWRFFFAFLVLYFTFTTFFQSLALTLYADPAQAALLMCGLVLAREDRNGAFALIPAVVLLILSKHVGLIFCGFIFIYYLLTQRFAYKKKIGESARNLAIPFFIVLSCFLAWSAYVEFYNISKRVVQFGTMSWLNIIESSQYISTIFHGLFLNRFPHAYWRDGSIFPGNPPGLYFWQVAVISIIVTFVLILGTKRPWPGKRVDLYFVTIFIVSYILFLGIIRATTSWTGDQWSFTRYLSVVLFAVVASYVPGLFTMTDRWQKVLVLGVSAVLSFIYSPPLKEVLGNKPAALFERNESFERKARTVLSHIGARQRVWYIHDQNDSLGYFIFRMKVMPAYVESLHPGWNIFYNPAGVGWPDKAARLDLFARRMCSVDILFIDGVQDFFWDDYAKLFDEPRVGQIYRVERDTGDYCRAVLLKD